MELKICEELNAVDKISATMQYGVVGVSTVTS